MSEDHLTDASAGASTALRRDRKLQKDDVIIGVEGHYLKTKGVQGRDEFSRNIASR